MAKFNQRERDQSRESHRIADIEAGTVARERWEAVRRRIEKDLLGG
jgi:hypothetical protein